MRERWMALELGQRQLVAGLVAAIVAVGLVTGAVAVLGGGSGGAHEHLQTASGPSTTTTTAADGSTSSTTASAAGSSSTTAHGSSTTSTTAKGTAKSTSGGGSATSTTAKGKGSGGATSSTVGATTTTAPVAACSSGGSSQADQIASLFCGYRRDHGLASMSRNSALDAVAQRWAQKLAADADAAVAAGQQPGLDASKDHNTADNPAATYPGGYSAAVKADCTRTCSSWAENVAYDTTAAGAWQGWLGSGPHLANIQSGPHGGEYGVGAAQGGGYWWYVQDFGFYP